MSCLVDDVTVQIGNRKYVVGDGDKNDKDSVKSHVLGDVDISEMDKAMERLEQQGKTAVCVAVGGSVAGVLGLQDKKKDEAAATVAALEAVGVKVWMLTG